MFETKYETMKQLKHGCLVRMKEENINRGVRILKLFFIQTVLF